MMKKALLIERSIFVTIFAVTLFQDLFIQANWIFEHSKQLQEEMSVALKINQPTFPEESQSLHNEFLLAC